MIIFFLLYHLLLLHFIRIRTLSLLYSYLRLVRIKFIIIIFMGQVSAVSTWVIKVMGFRHAPSIKHNNTIMTCFCTTLTSYSFAILLRHDFDVLIYRRVLIIAKSVSLAVKSFSCILRFVWKVEPFYFFIRKHSD